jgi:hypothetical protein
MTDSAFTAPDLLRFHLAAALPWLIAAVVLAVLAGCLWGASRSTWSREREILLKIGSVFVAFGVFTTAVVGLYALSHVLLVLAILVPVFLAVNYSAR